MHLMIARIKFKCYLDYDILKIMKSEFSFFLLMKEQKGIVVDGRLYLASCRNSMD
mgnify:CR=1 FL=1